MWQADGRHRAQSWGKANLQFDTFQLPAAKLRDWMWRGRGGGEKISDEKSEEE